MESLDHGRDVGACGFITSKGKTVNPKTYWPPPHFSQGNGCWFIFCLYSISAKHLPSTRGVGKLSSVSPGFTSSKRCFERYPGTCEKSVFRRNSKRSFENKVDSLHMT